jgi:hypothetical protein
MSVYPTVGPKDIEMGEIVNLVARSFLRVRHILADDKSRAMRVQE